MIKVLIDRAEFPTQRYEHAAWTVLGVYAVWRCCSWRCRTVGAAGFATSPRSALTTDFAITAALMFVFAWEPGQPLRALQFLVVLEAALSSGSQAV